MRAVLSCLAAVLLLGTSMGAVCQVRCEALASAGESCHMAAHAMAGMEQVPAMTGHQGMHAATQQRLAPACGEVGCSSEGHTVLAQVSWHGAHTLVDAVWVSLPAEQAPVALVHMASAASGGSGRHARFVPPQSQTQLRV